MPRTALDVPVPNADAYYTGAPGVGAHVTVLFPFAAEPDEAAIAALAAAHAPFDFRLVSVEQFEDGVRWLRPEPMAPFAALTAAVVARWPEHPPYEGAIADPTPHVTITVRDVGPLPIDCRAEVLELLVERDDGTWESRRRFPLGQGVA